MASAKDLRNRITSVKNTQQITKAMKMVSAAKLRRAQENMYAIRPYSTELKKVIKKLASALQGASEHPLLETSEREIKKSLYIIVTSDRGLCGSFNAALIKAVQRAVKIESPKYQSLDLAFIGKKGYEFFKSKKSGKYYNGFFTGLTFKKSEELSKELINDYLENKYDEIKFVYNEFKSALSQEVVFETFLPLLQDTSQPEENSDNPFILFEPGPEEILKSILPKYFATLTHRIMLESLAGEHAARMTAMENATKNAGEMIRKVTLLYNKTRQAGITKELLEIVSGTEAQKG